MSTLYKAKGGEEGGYQMEVPLSKEAKCVRKRKVFSVIRTIPLTLLFIIEIDTYPLTKQALQGQHFRSEGYMSLELFIRYTSATDVPHKRSHRSK